MTSAMPPTPPPAYLIPLAPTVPELFLLVHLVISFTKDEHRREVFEGDRQAVQRCRRKVES